MKIQRRKFLSTIGFASLAASLNVPQATASGAAVPGGKWDVTWTGRVNRKHRAVFDSPGFGDGLALYRAEAWKQEYKEIYGAAPEDMNAVLVIRGEGIWLAMNDVFWKKYDVGKARNLKSRHSGQFYEKNPVASPSSAVPPEFAGVDIASFLSSGGIILACHYAFGSVVELVKKVDKIATDEEAEKRATTFLLPGVILQPSGVFAVLRAQEAGCNYILAS